MKKSIELIIRILFDKLKFKLTRSSSNPGVFPATKKLISKTKDSNIGKAAIRLKIISFKNLPMQMSKKNKIKI